MSDRIISAPPERGATDFAGVMDALSVISRGNSVVLVVPPSAGYAEPVLSEALRRQGNRGAATPPDTGPDHSPPGLLVVPDGAFGAWVRSAGRAAQAAGKRSAGAATAVRARHHLQSGRTDLVVTTLAVVNVLLQQSALEVARLAWVGLAWPELEPDPEAFVGLFADLPKETPRLMITADLAATAGLAERYAWRAAQAGSLGTDPTERLPRFRAATTPWLGRIAALVALADLTDKDDATVWTLDDTDHATIAATLAGYGVTTTFITATTFERTAVWFYDAPPPAALAAADPVGSVLLAPPGVDRYLARVVDRVDNVTLPSGVDAATAAVAADRRAIRARIQTGPDRGALATLAPLLDQFSGADVAVALQALWSEARAAAPAQAPALPSRGAKPAKVWISAGKKDSVGTTDVIGALCGELKLARHAIGKVEVRDTFSLIEFASEDDAKAVATKMAGLTIKGRRLTARVDRGPSARRPA